MSDARPSNPRLARLEARLRAQFRPGFLQRSHTVFQFAVEDAAPFHLEVTENAFQLLPGRHPAPTLTLLVRSMDLCEALLVGEADGMQAFMDGGYRADGHIVLSQLLLYMFRSESDTSIYEVRD